MAEATASNSLVESSIDRNRVYGLKAFLELTCIGEAGLRAARRNGLLVRYAHGRAFIPGQAWFTYLDSASTDAPGPKVGTLPECVQGTLFDDEDEDEDDVR